MYATPVPSLMVIVFCSMPVHSFLYLAVWTVRLGLLYKLVIFCFYFAWLGAELASKPCRVCEKQYAGGKLLSASFFLSLLYTLFLIMPQDLYFGLRASSFATVCSLADCVKRENA